MEEFFSRTWDMLAGRLDSVMPARFFLQPAAAVTFAIRGALRDLFKQNQPFFLLDVFTGRVPRGSLLKKMWGDMGSVFIVAIVLDLVYQFWEFGRVYPGQALIIAIALSVIPYLLIRGPVMRILKNVRRTSEGFYMFLILMQTAGVMILYWKGLPVFRSLLNNPTSYDPRHSAQSWTIFATALIQIGYWLRFNLCPPPPHYVNAFLGHLVMFYSRMSFMLATTVFSFIFIQGRLGDKTILARNLIILAAIFSLYCYMKELKGLGKALIGPERKPQDGNVPAASFD